MNRYCTLIDWKFRQIADSTSIKICKCWKFPLYGLFWTLSSLTQVILMERQYFDFITIIGHFQMLMGVLLGIVLLYLRKSRVNNVWAIVSQNTNVQIACVAYSFIVYFNVATTKFDATIPVNYLKSWTPLIVLAVFDRGRVPKRFKFVAFITSSASFASNFCWTRFEFRKWIYAVGSVIGQIVVYKNVRTWKNLHKEILSAHILLVLSITGFVTYFMLDATLFIDQSKLALIYFRVSGIYEFYLLLAAHLIIHSISNLLMIFSVEKNDILSLVLTECTCATFMYLFGYFGGFYVMYEFIPSGWQILSSFLALVAYALYFDLKSCI